METKSQVQNKNSYYIVIAACGVLLGIVFMGQASLYSPIAPFVREKFNLTYTQTSIIATVQNLSSVAATLLITTIYDNLGVRKGLLIPLVCGVASALLFCFANGFIMVCLGGGLSYFCFALGGMMPASLIMKRWFIKRRGFVLGLCSAGSGITSMLLSGWISARVAASGIASAEIVIAIFVAVGGLIILLFIRNTPEEMGLTPYGSEDDAGQTETKKKKKVSYVNIKPLSPKEKVIMCAAVVCCGFTGFGAIPNFTLAATSLNYDPVFVGGLIGITGALAIGGKPFYGVLADAIGAHRANFVYMTAVAAADFLLFMTRPGMDFALYIVVIVFGLACYAITTVGVPIWTADLSSTASYSKNLKTFQTCSTVGGLVSAPLPGIIADATGNYGIYYLMLGVCLIFAMFTIAFMYGRHTKRVSANQ